VAHDPTSIRARGSLAESYNWLALAHKASGDRESELAAYQESRDIRQQIVHLLFQHKSIIDSRYHLLRANNNLSVWQWETDRLPDAIETLEQIVEDGEIVVAAQPQNRQAKRILAWGYAHMAFIRSMRGEDKDLLPSYARALELLTSLATGTAPNDGLQTDIATVLCRGSGVLLANGQTDEARKRVEEAIQILQSVSSSHCEHAYCYASCCALMAMICKKESNSSDETRQEYVQQAVSLLEKAVALEHPTAVRDIRRDRNFDGIRDEPLFQQLLASWPSR
jgi:tetratricopeptide (TPR) repeat protein